VRRWTIFAAAIALVAGAAAAAPAADHPPGYLIKPSTVDPAVRGYDDANVVFESARPDAPLVLFLPGTGGNPAWSTAFLNVVANQGYKVIGLMYDDTPAVANLCPPSPDPDCSAKFRGMRIWADVARAPVANSQAEAIETRLVKQLQWLAAHQPDAGWGAFLDGDKPRWDRIVVSGLSQGAGMAALIAKRTLVRRVVLFSSPFDTTANMRNTPAPWIYEPSATPPGRWYAEFHKRENSVQQLRNAYAALRIPADHIWAFDGDIPAGMRLGRANPYHLSTVANPAYIDRWRLMYGRGDDPPPTGR
jgi:hypothetical protein